jgi:hypothetical protein
LQHPVPRDLVQSVGAAHAIDDTGIQVILQILADPRQIVHNGDTVSAQQFRRPDSGKLQQLWRIDGAAGKQYLAPCPRPLHHSVL